MAKWWCLLAFIVVFLTEFTSPYSLNTQRGWHTSKWLGIRCNEVTCLLCCLSTFRLNLPTKFASLSVMLETVPLPSLFLLWTAPFPPWSLSLSLSHTHTHTHTYARARSSPVFEPRKLLQPPKNILLSFEWFNNLAKQWYLCHYCHPALNTFFFLPRFLSFRVH